MATSLVNFGTWTTGTGDPVRRKRLAFGYAVGIAVSMALVGAAILNSKAIAAEKEEEILDVQLATEPEPEPEPAPAPEPKAEKKPPPRRLSAPIEMPLDKPKEVEPTKDNSASDDDPFKDDDKPAPPPKEEKPIIKEAPKPPPRVAPPKPKGPIQVTENVTPPSAIVQTPPAYPADAKAAGIEGTVVVKYVVTETGAVTNVQIVRGPPELHAAVLAAVKSWRFRPAMLDGQPVAVSRVFRFPFRIKT